MRSVDSHLSTCRIELKSTQQKKLELVSDVERVKCLLGIPYDAELMKGSK